jgi:signal transduction histidine kinase
MKSYFAPPERAEQQNLAAAIEFAGKNPIISALLSSVGGLLAVLDKHRQIVALNDTFLQMLGVENPACVLGLRPGEALHCIHAHKESGGCGTSKFCSTCGAALAIVSSLEQDQPIERICALSTLTNGKMVDFALLIRSHPIQMEQQPFLLLFVQDITRQQQRAALERAFFHDINSMLGLLVGAAELMGHEEHSDLSESVRRASMRLSKEIAVHRYLMDQSASSQPKLNLMVISVSEIIEELDAFFASYRITYQQEIIFPDVFPNVRMESDLSLLLRVLCNMITNALEASCLEQGQGLGVKVWIEEEEGWLIFRVWNAQEIPAPIALRIFQLHFSTKAEAGRGIGTYSMKLIGEQLLGGSVTFTSSQEKGTEFRFALPVLQEDQKIQYHQAV